MPAGGDHERHADREDADDARLREHVADVVPGRERVRLEDRAGDEQERRRRSPARTPGARAPPHARRATDRRCGRWRLTATSSARSGASVGATAWRSSSCSVALAPSTSATISPSRMTRMRVQMPDELLELGRDDEHAEPGLGEVGDQPVELGLGRDVDAARRLVEQQHAAVAQQPAREHHLLLVAAREQRERSRSASSGTVLSARSCSRAAARSARDVEQAAAEKRPEVGEADVLGQAPVEQQALGLAVLGREPEAGRDRRAPGRSGRQLARRRRGPRPRRATSMP